VDQGLLSDDEEGAIYEISDDDFVVVSYRTFKALHNKVRRRAEVGESTLCGRER
jgi:hypothetical protein